jgi:aryl-alcohol dehydrogenase-like predicted oxidoreductase
MHGEKEDNFRPFGTISRDVMRLAWLMARPGITAPIASATSVEQVRELLDAATVQLTPEETLVLNTVSA